MWDKKVAEQLEKFKKDCNNIAGLQAMLKAAVGVQVMWPHPKVELVITLVVTMFLWCCQISSICNGFEIFLHLQHGLQPCMIGTPWDVWRLHRPSSFLEVMRLHLLMVHREETMNRNNVLFGLPSLDEETFYNWLVWAWWPSRKYASPGCPCCGCHSWRQSRADRDLQDHKVCG